MEVSCSVHHIVPRIHSQSSGTTNAVTRLCDSLHKLDVDVHLHVVKSAGQEFNFPLHVYSPWSISGKLSHAPKMKSSIKVATAAGCTIIHNHSLWMMPNVYSGQIAAETGTKLIVSPHGTLSTWALRNSSRKKKIIWHLGQRRTLDHAYCFHATAESEYEEIRRMGYKQPVAIIPNGIDFTGRRTPEGSTESCKILFLGRLHPIKGIEKLLNAWSVLCDQFRNWQVIIAGPEDKIGYKKVLQDLVTSRHIPRVTFLGPIHGEAKSQLYADAELYVLPTNSENFGITVAEALYQGTPAIVTKGAPWRALTDEKCGWWIDNTVVALQRSLQEAMQLSKEQRGDMGVRGHDLVTHTLNWKNIGSKMKRTYQWMLTPEDKPNWIIDE